MAARVPINFTGPMSFWKHNPCVPTWAGTAHAWWTNAPPRLLEPTPPPPGATSVPGLAMTRGLGPAPAPAAVEVAHFWNLWFSASHQARSDIPSAVVAAAITAGRWDIWIVRRTTGTQEIVGTVVRRWIHGLTIGMARWPRAGVVDFFVVHPAVRGKGVGRWLLNALQAGTPRPVPPHLLLWEGVGTVPPLAWGQLWSYQRPGPGPGPGPSPGPGPEATVKKCVDPSTQSSHWGSLTRTTFLHSAWDPVTTELSLWQTPAGIVAVQDLYHRSVPEGRRMAMIVAATTPAAVAAFAAASPWSLLLADRAWDAHWVRDSPFQWVGYNVLAGTVTTSYPCIGL